MAAGLARKGAGQGGGPVWFLHESSCASPALCQNSLGGSWLGEGGQEVPLEGPILESKL